MRGLATRFFDEERNCRNVPRVAHGHHKAINAAAGREAAFNHRRAQALHAFERFGFTGKIVRILRIDFCGIAHVKVSVRNNRMSRIRFAAHVNLFAIHECAHAFCGCVEFTEFGQINNRHQRFAFKMERNRNSPQRNATAKVHRAVDRVDNPAVARVRAFDNASFFGADGMRRKRRSKPFDNKLFTRDIGNGHNVFDSLVADIAKVVLEFKAKVACFKS